MKPKHWLIISFIVAIGLVYYFLKDVPVLRFLGIGGGANKGGDQAMPPEEVIPGGQPAPAPEKFPARFGDRGDHIVAMQWALNKILPDRQPLKTDGAWGSKTKAALEAYGMDGNTITENEYVALIQQAGAIVNK